MSRYWLLLLRLATLVTIGLSCALLFHYLAPAERAFCGAASGCEAVRKSPLAAFGPRGFLPGIGLTGYVALLWLTFQGSAARRWLLPAAGFGAAVGLGLLLYQAFVLHAFCWLCVTVDVLGLLIGVFAYLLHRTDASWARQWDSLKGWAWFALLALSANAPSVWLRVRARDLLPAAIQELQKPGVLTVVEFADFECPHCRRLHPILNAELASLTQPYRVVRFHVPLAFHIHARGAARAAVCAEQFDRGDAMANLLFAGGLETEALFAHATKLGIPEAAFRACFDAESTQATLLRHYAIFKSLGKSIVPLTFIGSESMEGYPGPDAVALVFDKATRPRFGGLSPYTFGAALLLTVLGLFAVGRHHSEA